MGLVVLQYKKKLYLKAYISFHFIGKIIADPHLGSSEYLSLVGPPWVYAKVHTIIEFPSSTLALSQTSLSIESSAKNQQQYLVLMNYHHAKKGEGM